MLRVGLADGRATSWAAFFQRPSGGFFERRVAEAGGAVERGDLGVSSSSATRSTALGVIMRVDFFS